MRLRKGLVLGGLAVGLAVWAATLPATTRQGINYRVTAHAIPWHLKALEFYLRDAHYHRLAHEVARGCLTPEARALAVFTWTREHIRPTPRGWPVIDDHIDHIIIRGYGEEDQAADVFTTLATYAGMPAFWKIVKARSGDGAAVLSFVNIAGRWTVWDVRRGFIFTNMSGTSASLEELRADPTLVDTVAGTTIQADQAYRRYIEDGLASFAVPAMLRAHQQMPGRRLLYVLECWWKKEGVACNAKP